MSQTIVAKFGGSSMADATAMLRSAKVAIDNKASLIVVSATYGTTNQLILLSELAQSASWQECESLIEDINNKHFQIAQDLKVSGEVLDSIKTLLKEVKTISRGINLLKECSPKAFDRLQSFGERLSSTLFVKAVQDCSEKPVEFLDAREIISTDDTFGKATPLISTIEKNCNDKLQKCLSSEVLMVTQGFIGQSSDGSTTTLGRGGSDYSAALFAEGMNATTLQIWTDVAGIATTDPRIVKEAKPIEEITFQEAAELATFGAKILHPTTLTPALRKNIQVFVGSSYEATAKGTWIKKECKDLPLIRAMALRDKQCLLTLSTPKMLHAHGFLFEIFKVFNDHKVSIDSITTSEISVAVTLDDATLLNKSLISDLEKLAKVKIEQDLTMVSLIGNSINHTPNLASKIFSALGDINVRMICLGASKHNFCFLVNELEGKNAITSLHKEFIS